MPTRNVVLTKHQHEFVDTLVAHGRYQNASEVLREGLRLVEQRENEDAARLAALREAVRVGQAAYAAGDYVEVAPADVGTFLSQIDQSAP